MYVYKIVQILKELYLLITSLFKKNNEISEKLFSIKPGSGVLNRNDFDSFTASSLKEIKVKSKGLPSISAIYRVKNGEEYIESAILSVAPLVTEIIVIDNGSSDNTKGIIERLSSQLNNIVSIKLYDYPIKTELAGDGYIDRVKENPNGSLAKFYEYCFSLGNSDYLMKCDAHYIFTLAGLVELQEKIRLKPDVVYYSGMEIYGKSLGYEPSLFKSNCDYKFLDKEKWEQLEFKNVNSLYIYKPVFLHIKRLSYVKNINIESDKNQAELRYQG